MTRFAARVRRSWAEFVGPEATRTNLALTVAASAAGLTASVWTARRAGAKTAAKMVLSVLATDLAGGAYVNNTRACARWYERPGQGHRHHLQFAGLHLHPVAIAVADRSVGQQDQVLRWSALHYGYLMASTVAIRRFPRHRRGLGLALTAGGLALDRVLGPSAVAPWFAWTYYPKLLMGHAASSLWPDDDLGAGARH